MMAQDHLSDREVREIIAYIKTLSPRWTHESVPPAISITAPMDLRALVGMGADLFKKAGCPECHGATGRGDGPSARSLTSGGRPTRPADLTVTPFKGGDQPEEIFRTLAVGIDGTPMPSYRDALEEREIWAISAYVESLARVGKRSAPTDDERVGHEIETRYQPGRRR
jgi:mono/diheme cytochrome c family protein